MALEGIGYYIHLGLYGYSDSHSIPASIMYPEGVGGFWRHILNTIL